MAMKYFLLIFSLICFYTVHAESKRIEVYSTGQAYWDVSPGDTLNDIITQLLPNSPSRRNALITEIVKLNPKAFSESNPDFLKANARLWLPGHSLSLNRQINKDKYTIKEFSWGYIQSRKK
jgi:Tfp pilus assembly protein FimV